MLRQGRRTPEVRMDPHERTPLERAWLHVIEGKAQVMLQAARIGELVILGHDTTKAEAVLADLDGTLRYLQEKLSLELERAEAARRHW
jgi:hypothetical protein